MTDLVNFLRAQLDEDERVARAADAGRWLPEDKGITFEYRADDFHEGEAQARLVADSRANQEHIASWYPGRVLAEVAAKRRILDLHRPERRRLSLLVDDEAGGGDVLWADLVCLVCYQQEVPPGVDPWWPCPTMRLLALPYADRPGYREEWRP